MRTFTIGGIHPPGNKISAGQPIHQMPLPQKAIILLNQHFGKPAVPVVTKGESVKVGQLLAKADGVLSANIHAPVSGTISKIGETQDASGYKHHAVWIDVEDDIWMDSIDKSSEIIRTCSLEAPAILEKIREAGIVGMGGATFPAHIKLTPPSGKKVETIIVNGVECEPYLTADHQLMLEKGEEILIGLTILMKAVNDTKRHYRH